MSVTTRAFISVGLCWSAFLAVEAPGAEDPSALTVTLQSGRTFTGAVDARTADSALVLRFGASRPSLLRPILWERIAAARHQGTGVPLAELPALAERIKTSLPQQPPDRSAELTNADPSTDLEKTPQAVSGITAIAFDVAIANWDADVEVDGLLLRLLPLDQYGQITTGSGTLEVELFAPQRRTFHHAPQSGGYSTELIARWTVAIERRESADNGMVLRLPFQAMHPEFRHDLYWYGLVHARLAVPGSGVFEHSQDGIALRPFTPIRDALQQNTGRRFLPTETTGRAKNDPVWRP